MKRSIGCGSLLRSSSKRVLEVFLFVTIYHCITKDSMALRGETSHS